jgi:hypothetical protein
MQACGAVPASGFMGLETEVDSHECKEPRGAPRGGSCAVLE